MLYGNPSCTAQMPREDMETWKPNYFLGIIQLLDDYPNCFTVGADRGLQTGAADLHVHLRESCDADGQEHWGAWGYPGAPGKRPSSRRTVTSCPQACGLYIHEGGPHLRSATCCWTIRCQLPHVLVPWPHVRSLCQPRTLVCGLRTPPLSRLQASPLKSSEAPLKS